MKRPKDFDLVIDRDTLNRLAPSLVNMLREFVTYGLCRQKNTVERKALAERFAHLAQEALETFPGLKLNHVGARTILQEDAELAAEWFERHRREDPHCTCPDCTQFHYGNREEA